MNWIGIKYNGASGRDGLFMDLKMKDVADLLQVSEKTIYRWISERKIPAYRINHQYRFSKSEINEWVLKNRINVTERLLDFNLTNIPVKLSEMLRKGGIHTGIIGESVREIIINAVESIPTPPEISKKTVSSLLLERELMMPTAIGNGIAIPHPRTPIISDIESESISLCILEKEVDYGAIDREPVRALFILISANPRRHLEILSKVTFLCRQPEFIGMIKNHENSDKLMDYVNLKEKEWNK